MNHPELSRRTLLKGSSMALAGMALLSHRWNAYAAPLKQGEEVLAWLDQPADNPVPEIVDNQPLWEEINSWITPNDQFFHVQHFGQPEVDLATWQLVIDGLVEHPMVLTLDDLKAWPRNELDYTLECSGNHGLPFLTGAIGNARWAGTSLAPILDEAGPLDDGIEVVFHGADSGEMNVRDTAFTQNFARSMSIEDAMSPHNMLCYEMNGESLPAQHGAPLRLIAPGWYGIANVKWLTRIEVRRNRFMGHFMAREYVTVREESRDGESVWNETSVGRALLKSAPARVVQTGAAYRIDGAAWGSPIQRVEVQIDDGDWQEVTLDKEHTGRFAWRFWSLDWPDAQPGEHAITSRATDMHGNLQPAADDPWLTSKITFWESNGQVTRRIEIP